MEYGIKIYFDRRSVQELSTQIKQALRITTGGGTSALAGMANQLGAGLKNIARGIGGMLKAMGASLKQFIVVSLLLAAIFSALDQLMQMFSILVELVGALVRPILNTLIPLFLAVAIVLLPFLKLMNMIFKPLYVALMKRLKERAKQLKEGGMSPEDFLATTLIDVLEVFAGFVGILFSKLGEYIAKALVRVIMFLVKTIGVLFIGLISVLVNALGAIASLIAGIFGEDAQKSVQGFFNNLHKGFASMAGNFVAYVGVMEELWVKGIELMGKEAMKMFLGLAQGTEGKFDLGAISNQILTGIAGLFGEDFRSSVEEATQLLDDFREQLDNIIATGGDLSTLQTVWDQFQTALNEGLTPIEALKGMVDALKQSAQEGATSVEQLNEKIKTSFQDMKVKISVEWGKVPDIIGAGMKLIFDIIIAAIIGLAAGIIAAIVGLPAAVVGILAALVYLVIQYWDQIASFIGNILGAIWAAIQAGINTIKNAILSLWNWTTSTWNSIVKAVGDAITRIKNFFSDAVSTITGLVQKAQEIIDKAKAIARDIIEGAKEALGLKKKEADDFILTPSGELIKTNPADWIIGVKDISSLRAGPREAGGTYNITINVTVQDGRDFVENIDRIVDEAVERIMNRKLGAYGVYR